MERLVAWKKELFKKLDLYVQAEVQEADEEIEFADTMEVYKDLRHHVDCVPVPPPGEMWDRFIEHYARKHGHVDKKTGKVTMVNFIGGIEHYRREFIEAQQGE